LFLDILKIQFRKIVLSSWILSVNILFLLGDHSLLFKNLLYKLLDVLIFIQMSSLQCIFQIRLTSYSVRKTIRFIIIILSFTALFMLSILSVNKVKARSKQISFKEDKKVDYYCLPKKIIKRQIYHTNFMTNVNIRSQIQNSFSLSNEEFAVQFYTYAQIIFKNRNIDFTHGAHVLIKYEYALLNKQTELAVYIRSNTGSLRMICMKCIFLQNPIIVRSAVYKMFYTKPNKYKPIDQKDKAKKFNTLQSFNLYLDVANLYRIQYRLQLSGNHWVEK